MLKVIEEQDKKIEKLSERGDATNNLDIGVRLDSIQKQIVEAEARQKKACTEALSNDQDSKKDRNIWSMYSGPILHTDTGKYCQNLKTWRKSDF